MATPLSAAHRRWRIKIFIATWLSYVGFYFCRKHWNAAKAAIESQNGWDLATTAGNVGAAYLLGYAIGQFLASGIATRIGMRANLLLGMGASIVIALAMSIAGSPWVFGGLMAILGVAQATGWSGNVGTMANWFHKHERGRVMGWWTTNFTIGSIVTGFVFAFVLGDVDVAHQPWQRCFWVGAAILAVIWVVFYFLQRNSPEDVGLPPIDDPVTEIDESKLVESHDISFTRDQWINVLLVGGFYFCAKLIRYAIWSWAVYFLQRKFHKSGSAANMYSLAFELCGIPGMVLTGWLSDRFFKSKRAGIALLMTLGMCVVTLMLLAWGDTSATTFALLLGGVGFFLFGPDALLSGAGAMDVGSRRIAVRATAVICGFGAIGPVVQEVIIPRVYDQKDTAAGLGPVFAILFLTALLAAAFCAALVWRNRTGKGI